MVKNNRGWFRKRYVVLTLAVGYIVICQSCMTMRTSPSKTKKYFEESNVKFINTSVEIKGHKLHYIVTGQDNNPTLVFVHGSPGSWDAFKRYLSDSLLLQKFRMISVDRPGFGYSDFGEAEDLQTQSDLLRALLKIADNHQPIFLVGHSLGGPLIAQMAADDPMAYEHIVILAGALDPAAEEAEIWRKYIMIKPVRFLIPGALRPSNDELWWLKGDLIRLKPGLNKITADVTVIHGTKDQLVPYSNVQYIEKTMVTAKSLDVISIKDANHFIPWENFELIRDKLLQIKF